MIGRIEVTHGNILILLIITGSILMILWLLSIVINDGIPGETFLQDTRKMLFAFFYHTILFMLFSKNRIVLKKAINYTLWVIVGFWWIQAIIYYGSGYYLDPLNLLGIREQKEAAYFLKGISYQMDVLRPTSFYNEPGTYGSTMIMLLVVHYLIDRKIKFLHIAALVSLVLSLSAFSILAGSAFLLLLIIDKVVTGVANKKCVWMMVGGVVFFIVFQIMKSYIEMRTTVVQGFVGAQYRISLLQDWLSFPMLRKVLGSGLFADEINMWSATSFPITFFGPSIRILGDMSFAFYLVSTVGIGLIPLIYIFKKYCRNKMFFLFFSIVFLMKLDLTLYALWATLSCMYLISVTDVEDSNTVDRTKLRAKVLEVTGF